MKRRIPVDQELAWYFGYAETAARLGSLTLLPPYVSMQAAAAGETEEEQLRRARALVLTVRTALHALPAQCAGVLRAAYTPRRWPLTVVREFGPFTAIVVRLICAAEPWPARSSHDGLEHAAARHLARQLVVDDGRAVATRVLRNGARRLMGRAITAYVRARTQRDVPPASS
ncbi:MAG: hypothetical protein ACLQVI_32195 [Polyangiaceae bacterium]